MIQIYADAARVWDASKSKWVFQDNVLVYDSRLESFDLLALEVTTGLNVGGTAVIMMPSSHPAYNAFQAYKTQIRVYREGRDGKPELRFRGRALYPADNFLGQRTITCEGELCFLRDSILTPGVMYEQPRTLFSLLVYMHNTQVDALKQFSIGEITLKDPLDNGFVNWETEKPETVLDALNKLRERYGGYFTFTDDDDGARVINWVPSVGTQSGQVIEFGENLLDFASTGANTKTLMTGLFPYGAIDSKTNQRITIASVNGGKAYIVDNDAVAEWGIIMGSHTWEDVSSPATLLTLAQSYLAEAKQFITSLTLTALDLSYMDKSIDTFTVGDTIRVVSAPHSVSEEFQLTTLTEDLLNPARSQVTLGKDVLSFTGEAVASDKQGRSALDAVQVQINHGQDLSEYVTKDTLTGYATTAQLQNFVTTGDLNNYATKGDLNGYATAEDLEAEVSARAGIVNKVGGVVQISGGAPINMLGGKVDIHGSEVNIGEGTEVVHLYSTDRVKVHGRMHMMDGMLDFSNNQGVRCYNTDGTVVYVLRIDPSNNTIVGTANNKTYLRGTTVYYGASNAVVTSDARNKNSIEELPQAYVDMLDKLTPVRFKYNDGISDRYHVGFIAQDVERALTEAGLCGKDFGGFVDLDGDGKHLGLAYDEFIGLLFGKIRRLEEKIKVLEDDHQ